MADRTHPFKRLIAAAALGAAILFCLGFLASRSSYVRSLARFLHATSYRGFNITGTIVDESGAPVNGVTMNVTSARTVKMGTETNYDSHYVSADGAFALDIKRVSGVTLTFTKAGLDVETFHFIDGGQFSNVRVVMRTREGGKAKPRYTVIRPPGSVQPSATGRAGP